MKPIFKLLAAGLVALTMTACTTGSNTIDNAISAVSNISQAKVSPEAVVLAASAFDAVKVTATNYLRLKRCDGTNGPICRDPALTSTIASAVATGTTARNGLKAFLRAHPGQLGPQGLYDALTGATATLKSALAAYAAAKQ